MANVSLEAAIALENITDSLLSIPPSSLVFPDQNNQSNYYPGEEQIIKGDVSAVAKVMERHSIESEHTLGRKIMDGTQFTFVILQASELPATTIQMNGHDLDATIRVESGDHAKEVSMICAALAEAVNDIRETLGSKNIVFVNRMSANNNSSRPCHYVYPSDVKEFRCCNHITSFIVTAIHELLGPGTGKLLTETAPDGGGVMKVEHDTAANAVYIDVDRSKITSHRKFYESLSVMDGDYEAWRQVVAS
ncbi:hypothetical protein BBP40_004546 [Aspergillus hancockii]|nr:hypothetical protein BBP40_004546 [Aspergillus hancockii]